MRIALGDDDGALDDGQAVNVQRSGEVDGRGHGAVLVDAQEVVGNGDRGRQSRVKFAGYGRVLGVERLGVLADDDVGFKGQFCVAGRETRRWGWVGGAELDAVY